MSQLSSTQSILLKPQTPVGQILTKSLAYKSRLKEIHFDDYFWHDAFVFLREHASLNQSFLLPDELCNIFQNTFSYCQTHTENRRKFDWVLLHKGRLLKVAPSVMEEVCRSFTPVFANEVFVLFSSPKAVRSQATTSIRRSPHVQALLAKLREQKLKQSFKKLAMYQTPLKKSGSKRKPTLLIEQGSSQDDPIDFPKAFVPLSWVATSNQHPYANLGDALSPILVSALSGLPVVHRDFDSWQRRLACVGTIAHGFKQGAVHFWGTGLDHNKNPDLNLPYYERPANTNFHVHAVRGLFTAQILKSQGIKVPPVYGDPVWFLPSIIKPATEKQYELGIVVHLTELAERTSTASVDPNLIRYHIPPSLQGRIRIITTLTEPSFAALEARVQDITACKRIVSTSLHGLVISEAYGIPCVAMRMNGSRTAFVQLDNEREKLDRRVRDFYSGIGIEKLFAYGQKRLEPTNWEDLIEAIDQYWTPLSWSPDDFLDAFPLPLVFNPLEGKEFENRSLFAQIKL